MEEKDQIRNDGGTIPPGGDVTGTTPVNTPPNVEKTTGHVGPTDQGDGATTEPIGDNEHSSER